ncbi:MAG TPA: sugar ABC transporter substrate-binding protein [Aggregatilineales bacterium]|nr:sugar ABC transporter substrate-binding protein [Aggregatilineales bacterium]
MKKTLVLIVLAALLLALIPAQAQDGKVTVTWWATERGRDTAATRDLHFKMARAFEAEHPNIQVAVALYPSSGFATRIVTAVAAGQGPDIWYHYYSPDVATQGFLADLTPFVEESGVAANWFTSAERRAVYDGRYYGVPRDAVAGFIAYNKDIFDAAGMAYPEDGWTIAEYREMANQLTDVENDVYGVGAIVGGEGCMLWSPFSFNLGAEITSPDGRDTVGYMDTPEAANAMRWCLEIVTEDQVAAPAELMDQFGELVFLSGSVAMQSVSDWEIAAITEQADFNWGVVAPPRFDENTDVIPWTDSYVYYMWEGSQQKEAAWELLEWLTGPTAQRMAAEAGVWSPNSPAVWEELGWNEDPIKSVSYDQLQAAERVPNYLRSQYFWDCVAGPLGDVRTLWIEAGERDVEAMMAEAAQTAQACLDENYASLGE